MENPLWSSPPREGEHGKWKTPPHKTIHVMVLQGKSDHEIFHETGIPRSTVQRIQKQESSQRLHKKRPNRPRMISAREIRHVIRFISRDYTSCRLPFKHVRAL